VTVIVDAHDELVAVHLRGDAGRARPGMAQHVRHRLLDDPKCRRIDGPRQPCRIDIEVDRDVEAGGSGRLDDGGDRGQSQRRGGSRVGRTRGLLTEDLDRATQFPQSLRGGTAHPFECGRAVVRVHGLGRHGGVQGSHRQSVADRVVEVAGDAHSFGVHPRLGGPGLLGRGEGGDARRLRAGLPDQADHGSQSDGGGRQGEFGDEAVPGQLGARIEVIEPVERRHGNQDRGTEHRP
jgi:hypothetical protein